MAFNLNDFRNKFANGGARPSQFEMQLTWPNALSGQTAGAETDFRFLCQISSIPASQVGVIEVPYFGKKAKFAGDRTFANLTVTIFNDENFEVRRALEIWSQAITAHQTSLSQFDGGNISGGYATDGTVTQYSRNLGGSAIAAYKFVGMFPTNLGEIALDWESADQFEKFTCEFAYQYWLPVDGSTGQPVSANF